MKIVIYGLAKSGTSALFYKIRNSLPPGTIALFEPRSYGLSDRFLDRLRALRSGRWAPSHVIAKVLPWDRRPIRIHDFDRFDRQIVLVRDPRDRLVSGLLYRNYHASFIRDEKSAAEFLDLLRQKEADPRSVSVLDLLTAFERLERGVDSPSSWIEQYKDRGIALPLQFHDRRPQLPVFRYEQLVDEEFGPLEEILGISLDGAASVPEALQRVVRTKRYGAWRNWFTPEDCDTLRPLFQPYLDRYYPTARWDLGTSAQLNPKYGSVYAERVINERRVLWGLAPLPRPA
ncbi:sulfotransferase family protein [Allosphingosinicella deserti]|uniref:Sulfotransferase domain-containing protein n=1 Tax=Allosphingosinicella deserti TaxID=2116704 RepID=A0A2P7QG80_9SPHN|nr:sulfotransferase domain-containing protein [Sphingomonas deserti]PSJ36926.1 hypothetical protein C7I55_24790 [Sphingomonas deserti]